MLVTVANGEPDVRISKTRRSLAIAACLAHAGCASHPDRIEPHYVSPATYQAWSCEQLADERIRLQKEVERVGGLQRENANADTAMMTVGIILLWPALFGLAATKDRKIELSRLKGEYEAVDLSIRTKACIAPAPAVAAAPAGSSAAAAGVVDGTYKGRGKTEAWCQTPAISLVLRGSAVEGELSELASGATTSTIAGAVDGAGAVALELKAANPDHFSGKVDGTLRSNLLTIEIRTKTARACTYSFELRKE